MAAALGGSAAPGPAPQARRRRVEAASRPVFIKKNDPENYIEFQTAFRPQHPPKIESHTP